MLINKYFINKSAHMSKSKQCYNAKPWAYYFYVRTKIPPDFHSCISVPLKAMKFNSSELIKKL